jgi:hypothetical protein
MGWKQNMLTITPNVQNRPNPYDSLVVPPLGAEDVFLNSTLPSLQTVISFVEADPKSFYDSLSPKVGLEESINLSLSSRDYVMADNPILYSQRMSPANNIVDFSRASALALPA